MKNLIKLFCLVVILALFVVGQNQLFAKSDNSSEGSSNRGKSDIKGQDSAGNRGKSEQSAGADRDNGKSQGKITKASREEEKKIENEEASKSGKVKVKKLEKIEVREATQSAQGKRHAIQGLVTAIDGSVITLVHQIQRGRVYKVLYSSSTLIKSKESSGSASLQVGLRIIVVGDLDGQGVLVAKRIFIIPGKATGIFKRLPISTSSATPSASSSASPSASLTPLPTATPSP